jgi:hypothetical protein
MFKKKKSVHHKCDIMKERERKSSFSDILKNKHMIIFHLISPEQRHIFLKFKIKRQVDFICFKM